MAQRTVRVRRVYAEAEPGDGARVLVDRVWPRGVRKDELKMDQWVKEVAPSTELRKWYRHDPHKFEEFRRRYREELDGDAGRRALDRLREASRYRTLTLLTATKDLPRSHAAVLSELLEDWT